MTEKAPSAGKADKAQEEQKQQAKMANVNRDLDESLSQVSLVAVDERVSKLEKALKEGNTVDVSDLITGLKKIDLSNKETRINFVEVLSKSLYGKMVFLDDVMTHMKQDVAADLVGPVLVDVLKFVLKKLECEVKFTAFVKESCRDKDVLEVIVGSGLSDEELGTALKKKGLLCLKPIPDLTDDVVAMLEGGKGPDAVKNLINERVGDRISVSNVGPAATTAAVTAALGDDGSVNADALKPFQGLLTRVLCVPTDLTMQTTCAFVAQELWFKKGAKKGEIKKLFQGLLALEVVSAEAFMDWRNDTKQGKKSKTKALLQLNSWLEEIKPKVETYDDEDEGDEGDEEEINIDY